MCEDLLELSRDFVSWNTHCLTFNEQECSASPYFSKLGAKIFKLGGLNFKLGNKNLKQETGNVDAGQFELYTDPDLFKSKCATLMRTRTNCALAGI